MIIKTVLFLTVVSIIGKYGGVHCSSFIDSYLKFTVKDVELINVKCHRAIYMVIQIGIYSDKLKGIFHNRRAETRRIRIHEYLIRLHRMYYSGENSYLKNIQPEIWHFYSSFMDWLGMENLSYNLKVGLAVDNLIMYMYDNVLKDIPEYNQYRFEDDEKLLDQQMIERDYKDCEEMLELLSKPTEIYFTQPYLHNQFHYQGFQYKYKTKNQKHMQLPVLIEHGFILLLLKEGENIMFTGMADEIQQKIFVVNIMKEILIEAFFIIKKELKEIGHGIVHNIEFIEDRDDPTVVKMKIIKSMIMKIIYATEALFNIGLFQQTYPDVISKYTNFMDMVKAKKNQLYPKLAEDREKQDDVSLSNEIKDRLTVANDGEKHDVSLFNEIKDPLTVAEDREKQDDVSLSNEIKDPLTGRLTSENSIRVQIFKHIIPFFEKNKNFTKNLQDFDNNIQLLLEIHGWLITIIEYAVLIKKGMPTTPIQQYSTMELTQIFKDDREFLNEFLVIPEDIDSEMILNIE